MRQVVTYVSYDDNEFSTYEECEDYENYSKDMFRQINDNINFYKEHVRLRLTIDIDDVVADDEFNAAIDELDTMYDEADAIKIINDVPASAVSWFVNLTGCKLPSEKGTWIWNSKDYIWEKVGLR